MTLPSFMSKPFTRKRYPPVIDHGAASRDYTATPTTATFYGSIQPGSIQPGSGTTDMVNRDGAEIVKTIFATDPAADVRHFDVITLADGDYFVNGEPERWETGILDHAVIQLSRWTG